MKLSKYIIRHQLSNNDFLQPFEAVCVNTAISIILKTNSNSTVAKAYHNHHQNQVNVINAKATIIDL